MADALIYLDPASPLTLQNQIREKLVELIVSGAVAAGSRLPSTRGLAEQLAVSRNTVVIAYQQLLGLAGRYSAELEPLRRLLSAAGVDADGPA